jgi:hypothetical protein
LYLISTAYLIHPASLTIETVRFARTIDRQGGIKKEGALRAVDVTQSVKLGKFQESNVQSILHLKSRAGPNVEMKKLAAFAANGIFSAKKYLCTRIR